VRQFCSQAFFFFNGFNCTTRKKLQHCLQLHVTIHQRRSINSAGEQGQRVTGVDLGRQADARSLVSTWVGNTSPPLRSKRPPSIAAAMETPAVREVGFLRWMVVK